MSKAEADLVSVDVLDGLGGRDAVVERWSLIQEALRDRARDHSERCRQDFNALLRQLAAGLVRDVEYILPRKSHPDLWRDVELGVTWNPINHVVQSGRHLLSESNAHRAELDAGRIPLFLDLAGRVLGHVRVAGSEAPADKTAEELAGGLTERQRLGLLIYQERGPLTDAGIANCLKGMRVRTSHDNWFDEGSCRDYIRRPLRDKRLVRKTEDIERSGWVVTSIGESVACVVRSWGVTLGGDPP